MRASHDVIGRDHELRAVEQFIERGADRFSVLVLEGEPGIGKTTIWRHGIDLARQHRTILTCSPTEAESGLAFAAAGDLLKSQARDAVETLPTPQRRALNAALLLDDVPGAPIEPHAVAVAFLGALREFARTGPVLVAVDDVQWLDPPSATLLGFALRRLDSEPVSFLLGHRVESGLPAPLGLDRLPADRVERRRVGPLSLGAVRSLLQGRSGVTFPRSILHRIHVISGGNPFYALELARVIQQRGLELQPGEALPVPATLMEIVRDRIEGLAPEVRLAVATVAALAAPDPATVGAEEELDTAIRARVIELQGQRLRFTHPLLAAAAYALVPPGQRRRLHERLSKRVADPVERGRHLALAAAGPSAHVAAAIEQAAAWAAGRGAPQSSAELLELAASLTPGDDVEDARRRRLAAAQDHATAGEATRSRALLEALLQEPLAARERCEVLLALAELEERDLRYAAARVAEAVRLVPDEAGLMARAYRLMSEIEFNLGDLKAAVERGREAVAQAELAGDIRLVVEAIAGLAMAETWLGDQTPGVLERGLELERSLADRPVAYSSPRFAHGLRLLARDHVDEAREVLEGQVVLARERGNETARGTCAFHLAELEWRAGRWSEANAYAEEALIVADEAGLEQSMSAALFARALVSLSLGRIVEARSDAERGVALSEAAGDETFRIQNTAALGILELSLGNTAEAARLLAPLWDILASRGYRDPNVFPVLPNAIEALVATGELDEAERQLTVLESLGRRSGSRTALAAAARCRGILTASRSDLEGAVVDLESALEIHGHAASPLEQGRTLLALGTVRRRRKEKRAARESLEAAISLFESLPAPVWADRARRELARIGGRVASGDLTETERRIADRVSRGDSNKEVAAQLFITPRTVEGHLTRIYAKLGVRSRAELATRISRTGQISQSHGVSGISPRQP